MRPDPKKKLLYRKVNTRARGVHHRTGGDYRHDRNTKAEKDSPATRGTMHGKVRRGLDYTPLFRFLLSKVGQPWDEVHSEAVARLDDPAPISWMVATGPGDPMHDIFRTENAYYSRLCVDDAGRLAFINPDLRNEDVTPSCRCCTHTFNGKILVNPYVSPYD